MATKMKCAIFSTLLGVIFMACAGPSLAQSTPPEQAQAVLGTEASNTHSTPIPVTAKLQALPIASLDAVPAPAAADADAVPTSATPAPAPAGKTGESDWHIIVAPYLWFPGIHGAIGGNNLVASVHASPGDLLSHFRFGLMGLVDTRYKRVVIPVDMFWVRVGDSRAFPRTEDTSVDVKGSEFILTPKIGYRLVDSEKVKIDALAGFRYWHFGQKLQFSPSGLTFNGSQNWVDPLVGARILGSLSPKIEVSVGGDAGGWGAGSQLDYQFVALLGYRIKPSTALQVGYRYLSVDYRSSGAIIDTITSGVLFGVSINLK